MLYCGSKISPCMKPGHPHSMSEVDPFVLPNALFICGKHTRKTANLAVLTV